MNLLNNNKGDNVFSKLIEKNIYQDLAKDFDYFTDKKVGIEYFI